MSDFNYKVKEDFERRLRRLENLNPHKTRNTHTRNPCKTIICNLEAKQHTDYCKKCKRKHKLNREAKDEAGNL